MTTQTVTMNNKLAFSRREAPSEPIYSAGVETILVQLDGDILTISDTGLFPGLSTAGMPYVGGALDDLNNFAANFRIFGRVTQRNDDNLTVELLSQPPRDDIQPFPVLPSPKSSCVVVLKDGLPYSLQAHGVDDGYDLKPGSKPASVRGWIFDAAVA
jgi:hypothetical protein